MDNWDKILSGTELHSLTDSSLSPDVTQPEEYRDEILDEESTSSESDSRTPCLTCNWTQNGEQYFCFKLKGESFYIAAGELSEVYQRLAVILEHVVWPEQRILPFRIKGETFYTMPDIMNLIKCYGPYYRSCCTSGFHSDKESEPHGDAASSMPHRNLASKSMDRVLSPSISDFKQKSCIPVQNCNGNKNNSLFSHDNSIENILVCSNCCSMLLPPKMMLESGQSALFNCPSCQSAQEIPTLIYRIDIPALIDCPNCSCLQEMPEYMHASEVPDFLCYNCHSKLVKSNKVHGIDETFLDGPHKQCV